MDKWILFMVLTTGSAPVTPERSVAQVIEFDDRVMCEFTRDAAATRFKAWRVDISFCAPKSSADLKKETKQEFLERFPNLAPKSP